MNIEMLPVDTVLTGDQFRAYAERVLKIYPGRYVFKTSIKSSIYNVKCLAGAILYGYEGMRPNRQYIIHDIQYDNEGYVTFIKIRRYRISPIDQLMETIMKSEK